MSKFLKRFIFFMQTLLLAGFSIPLWSEESDFSANNTYAVKKEDMIHYYYTTGSFIAPKITHLGPQISGEIKAVYADVGDIVKKNQELVQIDPVLFDLDVKSAKADLGAAKADLHDAVVNFKRMENLFKEGDFKESAVSKKNYDDAYIRKVMAKSRYQKALALKERAAERLKQTCIRAPYDAVVLKKMVDPGEPVNSAPITYMMDIQQIDTLYLEFSIPQEALAYVKAFKPAEQGTEVFYSIPNLCPETKAAITRIFPEIAVDTRSVKCRAEISNKDFLLKPGLLVDVKVIDREKKGVLTVPKTCLIPENGSYSLKVRKNSGVIQKIVKTGMETEDKVEIIEGLAEGENILLQ